MCKLALHMQYVHHPLPTKVGHHVVLEWPPWLTHGIQNCGQTPLGRLRCRCENSVEVKFKECALCPLLWTGSRDHTYNTKVWVIVSGVLVILFPQSCLVILCMHSCGAPAELQVQPILTYFTNQYHWFSCYVMWELCTCHCATVTFETSALCMVLLNALLSYAIVVHEMCSSYPQCHTAKPGPGQ
jgi:hypothetical protein